jgi:Raf kinase inhibitor-like YbhB/YbcL family protein
LRGSQLLCVVLVALAGCGGDEEPAVEAPPSIQVRSAAFDAGGAIPVKYTCEGDDVPPPLTWAKVPSSAKALALLMDDPDAGRYTHWVVFNMSPQATGVDGGEEGENSFGDVGYGGPCPPEGDDPHRYVFAVYALRNRLELKQGAKPDDVRDAITEQAIARGRLIGTFKRG